MSRNDDLISRQATLNSIDKIRQAMQMMDDTQRADIVMSGVRLCETAVRNQLTAQSKQTDCEYCHENFDGYVRPIEKNSHAFIYFGMNGWELNLRAKGWHGSAKIMYCPMCGRRLERG